MRKVRIFADPGGKSNTADIRLGQIKIEADEITGDIPKKERPGGISWWLILAVLAVLGAAAYFAYRKWWREEE